jgi:hypothetical protein
VIEEESNALIAEMIFMTLSIDMLIYSDTKYTKKRQGIALSLQIFSDFTTLYPASI